MFRKILVGLDSGETCDTIFERALRLAQSTGANLLLIGVVAPVDSVSAPILASSEESDNLPSADQSLWSVYQNLHQDFIEQERNRLSHFVKRAQATDVGAEFFQCAGSPGRVICQQAKACDADLIVVGSHGRIGMSELLLGSVSNYVLHHAPCSVFVIRELV